MRTRTRGLSTQSGRRVTHPLSSRPQRSLPLAEGNAEWRDLVSHADHICRRMALGKLGNVPSVPRFPTGPV